MSEHQHQEIQRIHRHLENQRALDRLRFQFQGLDQRAEARFDWESPAAIRQPEDPAPAQSAAIPDLIRLQEAARERSAPKQKPAPSNNLDFDQALHGDPWEAISPEEAARRQRNETNQFRVLQEREWRDARIPREFQKADLAKVPPNFPAPYQEAAILLSGLLEAPGAALLCGERLRGKSWLGCGLCRIFCRAGRSALYLNIDAGIKEIAEAPFDRKAAIRERFHRAQILIIDEADRNLTANLPAIETLVSMRTNERLSTLIILPWSLEQADRELGPTIGKRPSH